MAVEQTEAQPPSDATARWRRHFRHSRSGAQTEGTLESLDADPATENPSERIARAKEAMIKLIKDRFGGDANLIKQVDAIAVTSEEAVAILAEPAREPSQHQAAALEAIVAFDGSRPSFLVKENAIDFSTSLNTADWQKTLAPYADGLAALTSCVGRVELDAEHTGTAFLVTPTLAITNRHVAQLIGRFVNDKVRPWPGATVDFGREQWNGRASFDERQVEAIVFAGKDPILPPMSHQKLDLAVLRLSPSQLGGDLAQRHLTLGGITGDDFDFAKYVVAVGYPGNPQDFVPEKLKTEFAKVIDRLLEGDGGAKRLAPGLPDGMLTDPPAWTAKHDATTINGNSGSPLVVIKRGPAPKSFAAAGLHYGGDWDGGRVNWAHLLAMIGGTVGYGSKQTFAEFCKAEGIA